MVELLHLHVPKPYAFAVSVCDHGWPVLAPNQWLADQQSLQRVEQLTSERVVLLHINGEERTDAIQVNLAVQADGPLTTAESTELLARVRCVFDKIKSQHL